MEPVVKSGTKTLEFWLTTVGALVVACIPGISPDSVKIIVSWVIGRASQKAFGMVDEATDKPSWKTSEFWVSVVSSIFLAVFPDFPKEQADQLVGVVQTYIGGRTGVKIFKGFSFSTFLKALFAKKENNPDASEGK